MFIILYQFYFLIFKIKLIKLFCDIVEIVEIVGMVKVGRKLGVYMNTFSLAIYLDPNIVDESIIQLYKEACEKQRSIVREWQHRADERRAAYEPPFPMPPNMFVDSGFDLFCPAEMQIVPGLSIKLDHGIKCSMTFNSPPHGDPQPCGYYLCPRSSMGSKTPLRLSNSIGLIDSGYRGNIIAVVDNLGCTYTAEKGCRLVQLCPFDLRYPIYPYVVDSEEELSAKTTREQGGFGSTGM